MTARRVSFWIYLNILVTAVLSLISLYFRYEVEERNKAAGICAEADVIQTFSQAQGLTFAQGLSKLKVSGLTAVVIPEEYGSDLAARGEIQIKDGGFITGSPEGFERLTHGLNIRYPKLSGFAGQGEAGSALTVSDAGLIRGVAVGLNPTAAKNVHEAGLDIVARCANPPGASDTMVTQTVAWARSLGANVFLPEGEQVLGRRDSLDAFIGALKKYEMLYASAEFSKTGGDDNVVERAPEIVLRLHSAQTQELDKMTLEEALDRYGRAARERNQRMLLVRPISFAAPAPLDAFGTFIEKIKGETERQGGAIGEPHPFEDGKVPAPLFVAISLSIIPITLWTLGAFIRKPWLSILIVLLLLVLSVGTYGVIEKPFLTTLTTLSPQLMAFVAALVFPTAAFIILDRRNIRWWLWEYLVITLISLTGGLALAGLLNHLDYYIHAKQFLGVKVAHLAPILLIGAYFFFRFGLVKNLSGPVQWGRAFLALAVLGALGFMLARTGNDNPAAVSGTELRFRYLLDVILFVRPRTKEFLVGHPFLILGIAMMIWLRKDELRFENWKGWITLCLMLGAIGQTSIVNTMCHTHTPLVLSLARIGVGWVAGGIIGGAVWLVARKLRPLPGH